MIENVIFITEATTVWVSCTYCWTRHAARKVGGQLWLYGRCGHDPRRYFLDHNEYIAYVRRYEAEGNRHINEWDGQQEPLPLFAAAGGGVAGCRKEGRG